MLSLKKMPSNIVFYLNKPIHWIYAFCKHLKIKSGSVKQDFKIITVLDDTKEVCTVMWFPAKILYTVWSKMDVASMYNSISLALAISLILNYSLLFLFQTNFQHCHLEHKKGIISYTKCFKLVIAYNNLIELYLTRFLYFCQLNIIANIICKSK